LVANRPGLGALAYRVGTHGRFLQTMEAALSTYTVTAAGPDGLNRLYRPLARLTTRSTGDFSIALLDAWATVADVLTFYQERIANEGFVRTAAERRSILELAALVGYRLRPGVASSVFLAFTMEQGFQAILAAGNKAQSVPGPGERPQTFETGLPLDARWSWNVLQPRLTRPQTEDSIIGGMRIYVRGTTTNLRPGDPLLIDFETARSLFRTVEVAPQPAKDRTHPERDRTLVTLQPWLTSTSDGTAQSSLAIAVRTAAAELLKAGEAAGLLGRATGKTAAAQLQSLAELPESASDQAAASVLRRVIPRVKDLHTLALGQGFTKLEPWIGESVRRLQELERAAPAAAEEHPGVQPNAFGALATLLGPLSAPPSAHPPAGLFLPRSVADSLGPGSDALPQLVSVFRPEIARTLYAAWQNTPVTARQSVRAYALRATASVFGAAAGQKPLHFDPQTGAIDETGDWPVVEIDEAGALQRAHEEESTIYLEGSVPGILPASWVVIEEARTGLTKKFTGDHQSVLLFAKASAPNPGISRFNYGLSGKATQIGLLNEDGTAEQPWLDLKDGQDDFDAIRNTVVYARSEELALAEEPVEDDVAGDQLELDDLYDGLTSGRWAVVSGERTDVQGVEGVTAAEVVMIAGVTQGFDPDLPGDRTHTVLGLSSKLAYTYRRDTVVVSGNVARATHGESVSETLGSGDGARGYQSFTLKQPPLTYIAAATPSGAQDTLQVRVNDVLWPEADSLAILQSGERGYATAQSDDGRTTVSFGDRLHGARLPTGVENVRAAYRMGIGSGGNVAAEQISLLTSRPQGLKAVLNPVAATGGADPETADQARANAPTTTLALDRLVSVQDYADYARTFAGIAKADAVRLPDRGRTVVHLTIAGAADAAIDPTSDLYLALLGSLRAYGDPFVPLQVAVRDLLLVVMGARVAVGPEYEWASVEPRVRALLLDRFGFERRRLAQDLPASELIAAIRGVEGVAAVDLDALGAVGEATLAASAADPEGLAGVIGLATRLRALPARPGRGVQTQALISPAQILILDPSVPDTLILTEMTP